jgi:hypothetical protein
MHQPDQPAGGSSSGRSTHAQSPSRVFFRSRRRLKSGQPLSRDMSWVRHRLLCWIDVPFLSAGGTSDHEVDRCCAC